MKEHILRSQFIFLFLLSSPIASGAILLNIFQEGNIVRTETSGSFNLDALDSPPPEQFEFIPPGDFIAILPASSELVIDSASNAYGLQGLSYDLYSPNNTPIIDGALTAC